MKKTIFIIAISSTLFSSCKYFDKYFGETEKEYTIEKIESTRDSVSYSLGIAIADNFKKMSIDTTIDKEVFIAAISEYLNGKEKISLEEAQVFLDNYFAGKEKSKLASIKAKESSVIDSIKMSTPGIQVEESGLMYVVTQEGTGAYATATDSVQVEYVGKLMNGQTFDSSEAGKPVTFNLGGLIPGFTEGLQKVKEGGKIRLFIPSALAYRDMDQGPIPPYSTLMFDITLVKVYSKK
jgi:FKBP-type peptidyl-prolyl cis-trans isomerase FkpA/FKBP-type peptidyl-prolyl cis-trans isomerase FklB